MLTKFINIKSELSMEPLQRPPMPFDPSKEVNPYSKHVMVTLPDGEMVIAEKLEPIPMQRIICYNCKVMLEFKAGSKKV